MTKICYVFKGAGGYIAWYFGYAKYLQDNVDLSNVTFGGTSAGSIIATFLAANIPIKDAWNSWFMKLLGDLPPHFKFPNVEFVPVAKKHVFQLLTPEKFEKINERVHISLTNVNLQRVSVDEFESVEDIVNCVIASCHVPWVIDGNAIVKYKGSHYMDGSVYNTLTRGIDPYIPCGEKTRHIHIQIPYKSYEQIAALSQFTRSDFHNRNFIDGYLCAKEQHENKKAI